MLKEVEIPLEANGQEARFIEEVFTRTDTSDSVWSAGLGADGFFGDSWARSFAEQVEGGLSSLWAG